MLTAVAVVTAPLAISCFVSGGGRALHSAAEETLIIRRANMIEDALASAKDAITNAGKSVLDGAITATTGMDSAERDELMTKMTAGMMDFDDYVKMTSMMNDQGGIAGTINRLGSFSGLTEKMGIKNTDESQKELQVYCNIIGAMTEEQRTQPALFLFVQDKEENMAELANAAEVELAVVKKFIGQFKAMRTMFVKIGAGQKSGLSNRAIEKQIEQALEKDPDINLKIEKQQPLVLRKPKPQGYVKVKEDRREKTRYRDERAYRKEQMLKKKWTPKPGYVPPPKPMPKKWKGINGVRGRGPGWKGYQRKA